MATDNWRTGGGQLAPTGGVRAGGAAGAPGWRVTGRQAVTVVGAGGGRAVHRAGETIALADAGLDA